MDLGELEEGRLEPSEERRPGVPAQRGHAARGPRVVVGVDGSPAAVAALRWAAAEADRRRARLVVVVAYRHDTTLLPPLGTDAWHAARDVLDRALRAAGLDPRVRDGEGCETHIIDGSPGPSLVAAGRDAELIVVGQGHGPLSRTLLAAVNTERDGRPPCPVVVVPSAGL